jgi:LysR family pca operon transcriptional activator
MARLPADTSITLGPVGLTTHTDTQMSLPAQIFAQSVREVMRGMG